MRNYFTLIFVLCFSGLIAQENAQWIRYAAISPDGKQIAFTYKGDLYTVPVAGGDAKALTFHGAQDFMPVWSNDGSKISFASNRYGNFDLFVMDAKGGEPTRLTYHSNDEFPYTFTSDDKNIVFGGQRMDIASHRQYPTGAQPEVYQVAGNMRKQRIPTP
jgi:Tol biopolymer transport system component